MLQEPAFASVACGASAGRVSCGVMSLLQLALVRRTASIVTVAAN